MESLISHLEKDYKKFELSYAKQSVEKLLIRRSQTD